MVTLAEMTPEEWRRDRGNRLRRSWHGFSHFMASKMGVVGLVRALANELAADNIVVNAIHPGITDTEGASGMPNEQKGQVYMQQAIKRFATPADIAGPVAFLASDDARFVMTGQTLVVDGGWMRL